MGEKKTSNDVVLYQADCTIKSTTVQYLEPPEERMSLCHCEKLFILNLKSAVRVR